MKRYIKKLSLVTACSLPLAAHASSIPFIVEGTVKGGNNRSYGQIAAFMPVVENDDNLMFADIRFMHHLPQLKKKKNSLYDSKSYEANFGLGYRQAINEETVIGGAVYYDLRNTQIGSGLFSGMTFNVHFLTPTWQSHANVYVPVGKKEITKIDRSLTGNGKVLDRDIFFIYDENKVTEKSLPGADFRLSRNIPGLDALRVGSLFYFFKDKKTSIAGGGIDLSWEIAENIKFDTNYTYDKVRKSNILAGFRFSIPVGKARTKFSKLMSTRVERDLDIITNRQAIKSLQEVKQNDMVAIHKNDIGFGKTEAEEIKLLSKLDNIHSNKGTIILAEDGEEFVVDKVKKVSGAQLNQKITSEQTKALRELTPNASNAKVVVDRALAEKDPLNRQIKHLAAQKAIQTKTKSSSFFINGKHKYNIQKDLDKLFKKYAKHNATGNKTFTQNLPGYPNALIERAGTMLLLEENGQYYTVIAVDQHSKNRYQNQNKLPQSMWFGGQVDKGDKDLAETVARETFEESAGCIYISQKDFDNAIQEGRFFYGQHNKIFTIVHPDVSHLYNINNFANNLQKLKKDNSIAKSMKETATYHKVSVKEIEDLYPRMQNPNIHYKEHDPAYVVKDIKGKDLRIDRHYGRAFGQDPNSLKAIKKAISKF